MLKRKPIDAPREPKRRPADRRQQIVQASATLFAEHGFEATSVREIAARVKVLPGSLYHHFATKEDILHEILREPLARTAEATQALLTIEGNAEDRLIASVEQRLRGFVANWEMNAILWNDSAFFRAAPDFAYVQEAKAASFKVQEAILLDGMRSRLFRPDMDVYMMIGTVARMLSSAGDWFRGKVIVQTDPTEPYSLDRVIGFHIDCVLRLVRAPERLHLPVG